jgi:hypothetical protein
MEARSLTQLTTVPVAKRMPLIAEGLGLIAEHITTLHGDLLHLIQVGRRRSAAVVDGLAQEEAAKALILLDVVRMGWRDQALVRRQLSRFYNHLARGIYARVVEGRPADFAEVRRYVDNLRRSRYLDGPNDVDWIFRNTIMAEREDDLYVDYVVAEDERFWTTPARRDDYSAVRPGMIIELVIALDRLGCLSVEGLGVVATAWHGQLIKDDTPWKIVAAINRQIVDASLRAGLAQRELTDRDVRLILEQWTFPLFYLDLKEEKVESKDLQAQRDRWLADQS